MFILNWEKPPARFVCQPPQSSASSYFPATTTITLKYEIDKKPLNIVVEMLTMGIKPPKELMF